MPRTKCQAFFKDAAGSNSVGTKCQAFFKDAAGSNSVEFSILAFYDTRRASSPPHDLAREAPWTAAACCRFPEASLLAAPTAQPHLPAPTCSARAPRLLAKAPTATVGRGAACPKKTPPVAGRGGGRSRQRLTGIPGRHPRWCCGRTGGCRRAPGSSRPCRRALPRASARCTCRAWPRRRRVHPCR